MIYNTKWREELNNYVIPRLGVAHPDLTRIAGLLRNVNVEVWTETPTDASKVGNGKTAFSLEGWRIFYSAERQRLVTFNTANGASVQAFNAQIKTELDGYIASLPTIGSAMNTIMANYRDGSGRLVQMLVSQAHRDSLATAIEAELG